MNQNFGLQLNLKQWKVKLFFNKAKFVTQKFNQLKLNNVEYGKSCESVCHAKFFTVSWTTCYFEVY